MDPDPQFFCQGDHVDVRWVRLYVRDLNERLLCAVQYTWRLQLQHSAMTLTTWQHLRTRRRRYRNASKRVALASCSSRASTSPSDYCVSLRSPTPTSCCCCCYYDWRSCQVESATRPPLRRYNAVNVLQLILYFPLCF